MDDAATRLGRKLAALDLEPDERAVLVSLIGGTASPLEQGIDDQDVAGFLFGGGCSTAAGNRREIQFA